MTRGKSIAVTVVGLAFAAVAVAMVVVVPQSWPVALPGGLFFLPVGMIGAIEGFGAHLRAGTRARLMGGAGVPMGAGCGALAWTSWIAPSTFYRAPGMWGVAFGLAGLVCFGGAGLLLLVRGDRPIGTGRTGRERSASHLS